MSSCCGNVYVYMETSPNSPASRQSAILGLAIVGFVTLVIGGMWLAVDSTRFVPDVAGRIGTASVYLGSVLSLSPKPYLLVVPTVSTIVPIADTPITDISPLLKATATQLPTNLPDLAVNIIAVGYLATSSADSFVERSSVPVGKNPAIRFTIKNIGANKTGIWRFSASIPAQTSYTYQSQPQQSLNPGDSIGYTLGFDEANKGANQIISITANFDSTISESKTDNNSASAAITILGN